MPDREHAPDCSPAVLGAVVVGWFALTALGPLYRRIWGLAALHPILPATLRMTLMLLLTWVVIRRVEGRRFAEGFSWTTARLARSIAWGVLVAAAATVVVAAYQALVVVPLMKQTVVASAAAEEAGRAPFWSRFVEYLYIVYEGVVEVLTFIGFLLDRLVRRWGPVRALLATNVVFALWHYGYWRQGLLEGSLMIVLTFLAGTVISLAYLRAGNSVAPTVSHFLVDAPSGLKELFGIAIPLIG
jgi:membrane protease YdiL (CAAX protease family)